MSLDKEKINQILSSHVAYSLLSQRGKNMFFPTGIVWQTEQASNAKIKATAGMAFSHGKAIMLNNTKEILPNFDATQSVTYAPVAGIPTLRKAWHTYMLRKNPSINIQNTSLPIVTSGLTHGISTILGLFLDTNEILISPDMFWENYQHIVETSLNGKLESFPMFTQDEKPQFNTQALRTAIQQSVDKQGKAIILFNFPNNPTGYSITKNSVEKLKEIIHSFAEQDIPILILCDDAYFGLFYEDDIYPQSTFAVFSSLHKNVLAVKIDGATKELFAWGLRVGFLTFGCKEMTQDITQALETKVKGALRASVTSSSKISQSVVLRMLEDNNLDTLLEEQKIILKKRYQKLMLAVKQSSQKYPNSGLIPCPVNSGYFMSFKCTKTHSNTLREHLIEKEGLALISIENSTDNFLRLTFSAIDENLIESITDTIYKEAQALS